MNAKVLVVDDDDESVELVQALLGKEYAVTAARSGADALQVAARDMPNIILMDVEMPGMNGYEACRALRAVEPQRLATVFFVSAHTGAENRLAAYESGGDDFVSKPFNVKELKHKFSLALAQQAKRKDLSEKVQRANSIAMMSMREAADSGITLGYLSEISGQTGFDTIADTTLNTMGRFHVAGAVQLRDGQKRFSRNTGGECTGVEEAVLTEMAGRERIVDLGTRFAFNYQRATIIVYDMPVYDEELHGRLKDIVVKMVEALDVHLSALETLMAARARADALLAQLTQKTELARELRSWIMTLPELPGTEGLRAKLDALCAPIVDNAPELEPVAQRGSSTGVELF